MKSLVVFALFVLALPVRAQDTPHTEYARTALVAGIESFKAGHYEEAASDFEAAVHTEPTWRTARVYLATALSYQVVPNLDTPENVAMANRAIEQFKQILASDPENLDALRQIASLQRNVKRFDEAVATERKIVALDPKDAEAHYTIGVIEWTDAYKFTVLTLAKESLADDGNGNARMGTGSCSALIAHNMALIDDGTTELNRAVELDPTHDDAMSYLNLMYRRRADLDCANPTRREQDLATASEWIRRAGDARKAKEQRHEQPVTSSQ